MIQIANIFVELPFHKTLKFKIISWVKNIGSDYFVVKTVLNADTRALMKIEDFKIQGFETVFPLIEESNPLIRIIGLYGDGSTVFLKK